MKNASLETLSLAQFAAWYAPTKDSQSVHEDDNMALDLDDDADTGGREVKGGLYRRRQVCRMIRYRMYDKEDIKNHKREMVMLHIPFRNELMGVLDREKFIEI